MAYILFLDGLAIKALRTNVGGVFYANYKQHVPQIYDQVGFIIQHTRVRADVDG